MAAFNLKQYVKNVSRSAGYVIAETTKELNPTIAEFAEANGDALKEMYSAVRDYKKILREGKEAIANSEYKQIAKETVSNFLDDLKTGNFYNKERIKKNEMSFDFDMGDFDFDDWNNIDENWGEGSSDDDTLTFGAMDTIGQKMSMASGKAAMASADYVVKAGRANTKTILAHTDLMFGKVNTSLSAINSTIASVGKASVESAATHYNNSTKFYTTATDELAKQTGYLTQIYDLLKNRFVPKEKQSDKLKNRYGDVVDYNGIPNVKEYMSLVKENFKESTWISVATNLLGTLSAFDGGVPAMLRSALASPISSLMKMGTSATVKSVLGKDFEKFNRTLAGAFGTLMVKTNKKANSGGITGFLAEIFGIKPNSKKTIDTSKYEKGRVDWNGKDEKALREVIPTQLALILSAITGQDAKIFNYETGKWTTFKQLQQNLKKDVKNISRRATYDIQNQFEDYFLDDNKSSGMTRSSKAFHTFRQDSQNFFHYLTMNNDRIPFDDKEWDNLESRLDKFGLLVDSGASGSGGIMLRSNFNRIRQYYKRNEKNDKRYLNMNAPGQMLSGRNDIAQLYKNQENDPASMYGMLFSGVDKKSGFGSKEDKNLPKIKNHFLNSMVDDKGNNIFYYLQRFYMNLDRIEYNTRTGGGFGSGDNVARKRKTVLIPNRTKKLASKNAPTENDRFVDINDKEALKHSGIREEKKTEAELLEEKMKNIAKEWADAPLMKLGKPGQFLQKMLSIPAAKLSTMIDKADKNVYNLFYGETSDKPGIFAKITQGFDDTFAHIKSSIHAAIQDTFAPMATFIGDKIASAFGFYSFKDMWKEGILNSDFVQGVKGNLKGAWNWAKSGVKEAVSSTGNFFTGGRFTPKMKEVIGSVKGFTRRGEAAQAAYGGMVTKSGMVSVSEGELIIPSEKNPFYSKPTNKSAQITKENYTASKYKALGGGSYWGNYAGGGTAQKKLDLQRKAKKAYREKRKQIQKAKVYVQTTAEDAKDDIEEVLDNIRNTEGYKKVSGVYDTISKYLLERGLDVADRLFGKSHDKDGHVIDDKTRRENTKNAIASGWGEIKASSKHMAAGGIIGAGLSAITGMVGGPILGAAVGAATGLTINSRKFQQTLFGGEITDKNGDVIGHKYGEGILGKRTAEFLEKNFPQMAKFGLAGGLGGLLGVLPGGPIGGIMLGSSINFAMQNETFKNYLFGEEGIFGKDGEEKIKKVLPKMGIGAAIGALTGPFGLVGNIMLGGAIGFYTDTEKFKEAIFGIEDSDGNLQGGLLGVARDQVIDPMKNYFKGGMQKFEDHMKEYVFDPIANLLRPIGDVLDSTINKGIDFLKGQIKDNVVDPLAKKISDFFRPFTQFAGKLGKGAIKLAGKALKLGGESINEFGQEIDYNNIRKGRARSLSAEERFQRQTDFALERANYKTKAYDEFASTADYETLRKNKDIIDLYQNTKNDAVRGSRDLKQNFYNKITADTGFTASGKESKLIRNAFNKYAQDGNMDHVKSTIEMLVKNKKLSREQADRLLQQAEETQVRLQEIKGGNLDNMEKEAEDVAKSMGFKGLSDIDPKTKRLLASDIYNKKKELDSDKKKAEEKKKEESPLGAITLSDRDHTLLDSILHPVQEIKYLHEKSSVYLNDIRNGIFTLAKIDIPKDDAKGPAPVDKPAKENDKPSHPSAEDIVNGSSDNDEIVTKIDDNNNVVQFRKGKGNNLEPYMNDAGTKNAFKEKEEEKTLRHKFYNSMIGVKGFFSNLFHNDDEDKKENKESILEKIMKIAGLSGIGTSILSLFGSAALGIGGLVLGNNVENALTGHDPSKYNDKVDENGNVIPEFERKTISQRYVSNGLIKHALIGGATGSKLLSKVPFVGKAMNAGIKAVGTTRNKLLEKAIDSGVGTSIAKGVSSKVGKVGATLGTKLAATKVGKAASNFAGNMAANKVMKSVGGKAWDKATQSAFKETYKSFAKSGISNAAEMAAENVGASVVSGAANSGFFSKIISLLHSAISKALSFVGVKGADSIAREGAEQLAAVAAKEGTEQAGKLAVKNFNIVVKLGFIALAVENGIEDAKAILGIIEEPTWKERALAGAISGCNEVLLGIIPNEYIFNVLFAVLRATGIVDGEELQRKREEAIAITNDYNATNNETYNVREYINNVLGERTTQEKVMGFVGGAVKKVVVPVAKGVGKAVVGTGKAIGKGALAVGKGVVGAGKAVASGAVSFGKASVGVVKKVGSKIIDFAKSAKEAYDALQQLPKDMYAAFGDKSQSFGQVFNTPLTIPEDNPLKGITETVANVNRFAIMPGIFIKKIGLGIKKNVIDPILGRIIDTGNAIQDNAAAAHDMYMAGNVSGLLSLNASTGDDESNPIGFVSGVTNFVNKAALLLPTSFKWVGNKIDAVFEEISGPLLEAGNLMMSATDTAKKFKDDHDLIGLLTMDNAKDVEGPFKFLVGAEDVLHKVAYAAPTAFGALGDKLDEAFGVVKKTFDVRDLASELWEYTDPKKHESMDSYNDVINKYKQSNDNSIGGTINSVVATVVGGILRNVVSFIRPIVSVYEWFGDKFEWVKEKASGLVENARTSVNEYAGEGSGVHVSQKDPRYANKKFGRSTLGESGCGPAVAATVLSQYGKNASIDQTAGYALAKGYVAGASGVKGTRASYFSDILGSNGINSKYTSDKQDIKKAIGSGKPTILLGQNPGNRTKANSPFGPNPHYVVAQGTRDGKVVVNDPELGSPALYRSNILNNAKLGIMTGGDSKLDESLKILDEGRNKRAAANSGGANKELIEDSYNGQKVVDGNTNQAKVYQFFTQNGLSPEATIGMMGNIEQESGFKPDLIQGNGKGPAAGLFQWENYNSKSKRWAEMNKHAQSKGKDWTDIISQMEYALLEMKNEKWMWNTPKDSKYPHAKTFEEFAAMKDPVNAMYAFENAFERAGKPMYENRINATKKYAEMFTGAKISEPSNYGSDSNNYNSTGYSDESDSSDIGSMIDRALKNVFGGVLSRMGGVGPALSKLFGFSKDENAYAQNTLQDNVAYNSGDINFTSSKNTKQENAIVANMQKMLGWMGYSQTTRNDFKPGGWSDCSATVQHAIKSSIGVDPGGDTGAQIVSSNGRTVDIGTGNGPNENNLRPGDLLLYKRAKSEKPKKVGHVEMYMGDGKRAGHGGSKASPYGLDPTGEHGKGPFISDLNGDRERYIEARRFTNNGDALTDQVGAGSGIIDFTDRRKYSRNDITRIPVSREIRKVTSRINSIGGDSELLSTNNQELLKIMTEYLHIIAQNTTANTNIKTIVEILQSIMNIIPDKASMTQTQPVVINQGSSEQENSDDTKIEMEMKSIIDKLQQLAQAV